MPDDDFLAGLVQETMFLNLFEVVRSPKGRKKVESVELDIDFSATEMDKDELLLLLEAVDVAVDPVPPMSIGSIGRTMVSGFHQRIMTNHELYLHLQDSSIGYKHVRTFIQRCIFSQEYPS